MNNIIEEIDNQQRNNNLYKGKVVKECHYNSIIDDYINGESLIRLSNQYGYNIATIRYFLLRNSIVIRNVKESVKPFHKIKNIEIDSFLHENLIGWIMGDGGLRISKNSINPYFNYTDLKESHILYVESILNSYNIKTNITQNKKSMCYQLQTESLSDFMEYYKLFYGYEGLNENEQKRKILPNIKLTPIILRNWFIGDGSSCKQKDCYNNKGSICCKYRNEMILEQLNNLCGVVTCYMYKNNTGNCHTYYFNNKSFIRLLEYIGECPVEEYKYKWIVRRSTTIINESLGTMV